MKAIVFDSNVKQFFLENVEIPRIQENEVLVRVKACGICGSDLHLSEGILKPKKKKSFRDMKLLEL